MLQKRGVLSLIILLSLLLAVPLAAGAEELGLTGEQKQLHGEMMRTFIAPDFCGKSLEECPAQITVDMRDGILAQIRAGATKEEIIAHWTGIYGERILAAPPKAGFFLSAWILPIIGLIVGVFILSGSLKGRMKGSPNGAAKNKKQAVSDEYEEELAEEILKHM